MTNNHSIGSRQPYTTVRQAIDDLRNITDDKVLSHLRAKHSAKFSTKIKTTPIGQNVGTYSESFHRCDPDKPSPTVKANNGSVFVHYVEDRLMTPRELARLQGFADSHRFCGNKRDILIQIGNAVPVELATAIALVTKTTLHGTPAREMHNPMLRKLALCMRRMRTLRDTLSDLPVPLPAVMPGNRANPALPVANHEFFLGRYSSRYMGRQRVRGWDEPSFTILAGGRYAPQHPSVSPMKWIKQDEFGFTGPDRRLSVRECARIQGFPDSFRFIYELVNDGYALAGNAVPVPLAKAFGDVILKTLSVPGGRQFG